VFVWKQYHRELLPEVHLAARLEQHLQQPQPQPQPRQHHQHHLHPHPLQPKYKITIIRLDNQNYKIPFIQKNQLENNERENSNIYGQKKNNQPQL
jgi:hypothetical protein